MAVHCLGDPGSRPDSVFGEALLTMTANGQSCGWAYGSAYTGAKAVWMMSHDDTPDTRRIMAELLAHVTATIKTSIWGNL